MGIALMKQNDDVTYNLKYYFCDSNADISSLPTNCAPGSRAICGTGELYMLSTGKEWKQFFTAPNPGDMDCDCLDDIVMISAGQIQSLF